MGVGSEEVDFEGLSCARLLTPEMTVESLPPRTAQYVGKDMDQRELDGGH